ncbi:MAG: hypothetical protein HOO92_12380 [Methylococcaceae bacterium]|nr:hypothetical protein [Methylococcaceae bacterium]
MENIAIDPKPPMTMNLPMIENGQIADSRKIKNRISGMADMPTRPKTRTVQSLINNVEKPRFLCYC